MKIKHIRLGVLALALTLTIQAQAQVFLTGGLVAFYPFSGNANDQSGLANNPTANTASLTYDRFARTNAAYAFGGAESIQYASQPQLETLTSLTVTCWVRTTNAPGAFVGLISKANTIPVLWTGIEVGLLQNNVQVQINHANLTGAATINDGNWHSVCVVFDNDAGQVLLYVDGQLDGQLANPVNSPNVTDSLYLGMDRLAAAFFNGSLDQVRIYNRALSSRQAKQLNAIEAADFSLPFVPLAFTMTIEKQGTTTVAGNVSTTAKPVKMSLKTVDLLKALAQDLHAQGSWPSNGFPAKTSLVLAGHSVVVLNGTNVLLYVSDIISYSASKNLVFSGMQNNTTGLAATKMTLLKAVSFMFDDTFVDGGSNLKFYLDGQLNLSVTDTAPVSGAYTETRKFAFTSGTGDGWINGTSFVGTGKVAGSTSKTPLQL